jgi:O-antigen/teichoic acid export membrane protein
VAGTAAVPVFTTVRTLMNLWTSVTTVLSSPLLPDVVRIHAKGEIHKLVPINQTYWVLVGSAVNWGTLLIYPVLPWIYARWTTHAVALNGPLLSFMLASVVVTNAGALVSLHLNGINSLGIVLTASLARAALGLGIGLLGYSHMGLASFGIGAVAAEVAVMVITCRYFVNHELASKGVHLPLRTLGPALTGTGSAVLYFLGSGLGWWSGTGVWVLALIGVAVGSISGWRALDASLRRRLLELPARLLRR